MRGLRVTTRNARVDYPKTRKKMSTRQELQERQSTPLALNNSAESFNATNGQISSNPADCSKSLSHWGSGYNSQLGASMSGHNVFVLDVNGKPLTPTTNSKARKLMKNNQAKPIWNKFSQFGIQMLVDTRKETPKTVLGVDFGTKFEGYSIVVGTENNLSVMWKFPDKKNLVRKLTERRQLRRARRYRNCRRRPERFDNRKKDDFIAPSQLQIVNSRLKCMNQFFKCYPISDVALEDVRFNHRDNRWGKNFSTVEIGKTTIKKWIRERAQLHLCSGIDTQGCRDRYSYKKSSNKGAETFNSHCSDALAIATDLYVQKHIEHGSFIIVDDKYRPVRRQLHDTQPSKDSIRYIYSTGNFNGVRKGVICELGLIAGGTGNSYSIYPSQELNGNEKRIRKVITKIKWLSHKFKIKEDVLISHCNKIAVIS